jgi:thiol-disulfide isomerase/thioredoxin
MHKYQALGIVTLLAVILIPGTSGALGIPDLLKDHNFTLYRLPTPANEMKLQSLRGRPLNLSQLTGKVVLLNFWKIDCPPCALEKPILERVYRRFAGRGLEVVAVNLFDDYARIISYVRDGGYSYTFAHDPNNLFTVKQQPMRSGVSTSFVVNSHAEAIYEVKGVPTTYVINREGKVVGHAVGMVNWEQGPMLKLLESLLGPPSPTVIAARKPPAHSPAFRSQAAGPIEPHRPNHTTSVQHKLPGRTAPVVVANPKPSPAESVRRTQSRSRTIESRSLRPRAEGPQVTIRTASPARPARNPAPSARTRSTVPPSRVAAPAPSRRAPDRVRSTQTARTRAGGSDRNRTGRTIAAAPPSTPMAETGMHTRLNPLPRATPYYRPGTPAQDRSQAGRSGLRAPVVYDENGYVMARIPGSDEAPRANSGSSPQFRQTGGPAASAHQRTGANPINGFILESFGRGPSGTANESTARREGSNDQSDSSFLGRITSGISSTLSGINPLSR